MTEFHDSGPYWLERMAGAAAGSIISLIYLLPANRHEAASRLATSLACGMVFGAETGAVLSRWLSLADDLSGSEKMLSGSAAAGLVAWWGLGLLTRIARISESRWTLRALGDRDPEKPPANPPANPVVGPSSQKDETP